MTPEQIQLLRDSFARLEAQADIAALVFYRHLFNRAPELRSLFNSSIEVQGRKLMESLRYTIATLEKPDELVPVLESLGRRHITYGTKDEHYALVIQVLMQMLAEVLGKHFSAATAAVWQEALSFVCATMQRGARDVQELSHPTL
jgi:hemoglobin-like flavoprotein